MNWLEEFYKSLSKKERRIARKEDREKELAAIRRNKILRRIFFWNYSFLAHFVENLELHSEANKFSLQNGAPSTTSAIKFLPKTSSSFAQPEFIH